MTIICPTCQAPNEETHQFCATCGTKLSRPVVVARRRCLRYPRPDHLRRRLHPQHFRRPRHPRPYRRPSLPSRPPRRGSRAAGLPAQAAPPAAPAHLPRPQPLVVDARSGGTPRGSLARPIRLSAKVIIGGVIAALILAGAAGLAIGAVLNPKASPIPVPAPSASAAPSSAPW